VPEKLVIVDTGPLVAFLVKEEANHHWVARQFCQLPAPFLTCEPVLTEAFFLTSKLPEEQPNSLHYLIADYCVSTFR